MKAHTMNTTYPAPMFAILYDRHGQEEARRTLGDVDSLNPEDYAQSFAAMLGIDELEPSTPAAEIPDGCEDYRIEITEEPNAPRVWKSCNFFAISNN
jgi:hypothetical protein